TRQAEIEGVPVTINGIAKGAGMIAPDMATMLAFLFTDAAVEPRPLHEILSPAVDATFNAITIDGDTSTRDTLLLFATGTAASRGAPHIGLPHDPRPAGLCGAAEYRPAARSAACGLPRRAHRGASRSCAPGGERRRGGDQVRHG